MGIADRYYQPADPKPYPRCAVTLEEMERPVPSTSGDEGYLFVTIRAELLPDGSTRAHLMDSGAVGYEWPEREQFEDIALTDQEQEWVREGAADLESLGDW